MTLEEKANKGKKMKIPSNEEIKKMFNELDCEHNNHFFDNDDWFNQGFKAAIEYFKIK